MRRQRGNWWKRAARKSRAARRNRQARKDRKGWKDREGRGNPGHGIRAASILKQPAEPLERLQRWRTRRHRRFRGTFRHDDRRHHARLVLEPVLKQLDSGDCFQSVRLVLQRPSLAESDQRIADQMLDEAEPVDFAGHLRALDVGDDRAEAALDAVAQGPVGDVGLEEAARNWWPLRVFVARVGAEVRLGQLQRPDLLVRQPDNLDLVAIVDPERGKAARIQLGPGVRFRPLQLRRHIQVAEALAQPGKRLEHADSQHRCGRCLAAPSQRMELVGRICHIAQQAQGLVMIGGDRFLSHGCTPSAEESVGVAGVGVARVGVARVGVARVGVARVGSLESGSLVSG